MIIKIPQGGSATSDWGGIQKCWFLEREENRSSKGNKKLSQNGARTGTNQKPMPYMAPPWEIRQGRIGGSQVLWQVWQYVVGMCFSMFVYIRARFRFALIGGNLTAQPTGSHREIGGGIEMPETELQALLSFPAQPLEPLGELARRLPYRFLYFLCY